MKWTKERKEEAAKLWRKGWSATDIAAYLGGVTRNAVIGKMHRMGLGRGDQNKNKGGRKEDPRRAKIKTMPVSAAKIYQLKLDREIKDEQRVKFLKETAKRVNREKAEIPKVQRVSLVELTSDTCRWPIGDPQDPDFFFCGAQPSGGMVYCAHHCGIAYVAPVARTAKRAA